MMSPFKIGDRVRVRKEHRCRFNGPASEGCVLTVQGQNLSAVAIGPLFMDYAYHWELVLV